MKNSIIKRDIRIRLLYGYFLQFDQNKRYFFLFYCLYVIIHIKMNVLFALL